MKYNPDIHHRRSIRLKNYDYSQTGVYFITICTYNKECLFGNVLNGVMRLNKAGKMVQKWWGKIAIKFKNIESDGFVIMPNHFHGIIFIVGADLRVCPDTKKGEHTGSLLQIPGGQILGEHMGSPLHKIVQWFKTMTTNEYIRGIKLFDWHPFNGKLWQRNYYEHIVRNEAELNKTREYIINNPLNWHDDENYMPNWQKEAAWRNFTVLKRIYNL